jgi:hypothetical protein
MSCSAVFVVRGILNSCRKFLSVPALRESVKGCDTYRIGRKGNARRIQRMEKATRKRYMSASVHQTRQGPSTARAPKLKQSIHTNLMLPLFALLSLM